MARQHANWWGIGFDAWFLGLEAAHVIWLRGWLMMLGGTRAEREARLMVAEKLAAHSAFAVALATGGAGHSPDAVGRKALRHYRGRVRANRRRLSRP